MLENQVKIVEGLVFASGLQGQYSIIESCSQNVHSTEGRKLSWMEVVGFQIKKKTGNSGGPQTRRRLK